MSKMQGRNSGLVGFGVFGAVLLVALLGLHLASCNGNSAAKQSTTPTSPPTTTGVNVTTYHYDTARTGQNLSETMLTPSNVNSSNFGKLFVISVDGRVDAQPLYLTQVSIPNKGTHNVLYVETEHASVYGFDADSGTLLWQVSMLAAGETTSDDHGCGQITPEIGITSTPGHRPQSGPAWHDLRGRNVEGRSRKLPPATPRFGRDYRGRTVWWPAEYSGLFPGTGDNNSGGNVVFAPGQYAERAGLLLLNGIVYTGWTSHCDIRPYTGWIMGFDQSTLAQVSVLNVTPNGNEGSVWMSGAGLAADTSGNIFVLDANGTFDTTLDTNGFPSQGDFGNAFLKISTANMR